MHSIKTLFILVARQLIKENTIWNLQIRIR